MKGGQRCPLCLQTAQVNCALPPVGALARVVSPSTGSCYGRRDGPARRRRRRRKDGRWECCERRVSWKSEEVLSGSGVAWQTRWHLQTHSINPLQKARDKVSTSPSHTLTLRQLLLPWLNLFFLAWFISAPPSSPSPALSLAQPAELYTNSMCFCHVVICASCSRFWQSPVVAHRKRFPRGVFKRKKKSLRQITRRPQPANGVQTSCQTTYYGLAPQTTQHNANSLHEFWPLRTPQLISLQRKQQTENLSDQASLTKKQKKRRGNL